MSSKKVVHSNAVSSVTVVVFTFLTSGIFFGICGYYFGRHSFNSIQSKNYTDKFLNSPTPRANIPQELTLRNVSFHIPAHWWSNKGDNTIQNTVWYDLNPISVGDPYSTVPVFEFSTYEENISLQAKRDEIIKTWHLIDTKVSNISSGNTNGISISGKVDPKRDNYNSRFDKNALVEIVLFRHGKDIVELLGDVSDPVNQTVFGDILSSVRFTEN